jgi:hypothetical protein
VLGVGANEVRLGSPPAVVVAELTTVVGAPGAVVAEADVDGAVVDDETTAVEVVDVVEVVVDAVADVLLIVAGSLVTRNQRTPSGNSARILHASSPDRLTDTCTPAHDDPYRAIDSS